MRRNRRVMLSVRCLAVTILLTALLSVPAGAVLLTDEQLYFDPESAGFDYYPRVLLPDLSVENTYTWEAETDPVVDADILPVLKAGNYSLGYTFSQDDYEQTPNVDYSADLTAGALTATFEVSAQYLVRIHRTSGAEQIYTVFAETGLLEHGSHTDQTGPSRAIGAPHGDVIVVATGDSTVNQAAENCIESHRYVQRASSVAGVVTHAMNRYNELGEKIHLEIVGHGAPGSICLNDDSSADEDIIGPDKADVQEFLAQIQPYCDGISFFSCSTGEGAAGDSLLKWCKDALGGEASAWPCPISVEDGYFNADIWKDAKLLALTSVEELDAIEQSWGRIKDRYR